MKGVRSYPEQFVVRLTPEVGSYLDRLMVEGGYNSRAQLLRLIIEELKRDDESEHGVSLS